MNRAIQGLTWEAKRITMKARHLRYGASGKMTLLTYLQMLIVAAPDVQESPVLEDTAVDDTRWKVIAHDDPVTTMDFVVWAMVQFFYKPLIFAEAIMWQVHTEGQSVVDVLPKAEAERRVAQATFAARLQGFPFRFTIEPDQ